MEKILQDTAPMGRSLTQESQTIQSELKAYLNTPSEESRIKMMQDALHLKNQMREL